MTMQNETNNVNPPAPVGSTGLVGATAYVRVMIGQREWSDFMASAGLGVTGIGYSETWIIGYKPGENVDEARVMSAMQKVKEEMDNEHHAMKIHSFKLIHIEQAPTAEA